MVGFPGQANYAAAKAGVTPKCQAKRSGGMPKSASKEEKATAKYFEAVRVNAASTTQFLKLMPKGGDIHTHVRAATAPCQPAALPESEAGGLAGGAGINPIIHCASGDEPRH